MDYYDRKMKAFDTLDDKAQKPWRSSAEARVYARCSAGLGNLTIFILVRCCSAPAVFFFLSVLLLLISLYPRERDILAISEFNSVPVLSDPAFRARIARRLIDAWQHYF